MSYSVLILLSKALLIFGLVLTDTNRFGKSNLDNYCILAGGKCQLKCDKGTEIELKKRENLCTDNLTCCVSRPQDRSEGCGVPVLSRIRRIVGGSQAKRCYLPWMVYISRDYEKASMCGGVLISDRHVATAAHCFEFLENIWPTLYIGEYDRRNNSSKNKFVTSSYKVTRHPNYNRITFSFDIAILTLHMPIPMKNYECIRPICLPGINDTVKVGDICTVAGWGTTSRTQYHPAISSPLLMKTDIRILEDSICQDKFGMYFNRLSQICAGDISGNADSCSGDSGGPLTCSTHRSNNKSSTEMSPQVLMGIISSGGTPCAQVGTPALYTDVKEVMEWIQSILK